MLELSSCLYDKQENGLDDFICWWKREFIVLMDQQLLPLEQQQGVSAILFWSEFLNLKSISTVCVLAYVISLDGYNNQVG